MVGGHLRAARAAQAASARLVWAEGAIQVPAGNAQNLRRAPVEGRAALWAHRMGSVALLSSLACPKRQRCMLHIGGGELLLQGWPVGWVIVCGHL